MSEALGLYSVSDIPVMLADLRGHRMSVVLAGREVFDYKLEVILYSITKFDHNTPLACCADSPSVKLADEVQQS